MLRERECWSNDKVISLSRWLKQKKQFPTHTKRKNATEQAYQEKLISTVLYNTFVTLFFEEPLCKQLSNQTVMIHFFIFPLCRIKLHRLLLLFTLHVIGQIKYYLLTKSEVITGKSQTKALMY